MKKSEKHIRYLKILFELLIDILPFLILFIIVFLMLEHIGIIAKSITLLIQKILKKLFQGMSADEYQIMTFLFGKISDAFFSVLLSILIGNFFRNIWGKKKISAKLKSSIYYNLNKRYGLSRKWFLQKAIPVLINIFLHKKPLNYYKQADYVAHLVECLGKSTGTLQEKHIIWLSGESYSGKTTIIFRFLKELTAKKNVALFEEYEKQIYYYDLGTPSLDIGVLYQNVSNSRYVNSLLILDNIHKLELSDLRNFVTILENYHNNIKFIICCARELDEFCYSQEIYERLERFIEEFSVYIGITPISHTRDSVVIPQVKICDEIALNVSSSKDRFDIFCWKTIGKQSPNNLVLIVQCYNLYMSSQDKKICKFIYRVYDTLNGQTTNMVLLKVLSFIIYGTLFSGGFEEKWFYEYTKQMDSKKNRIRANMYYKQLQKSSFISIICSGSANEIVFHEKLAKYYFECINDNADFIQTSDAVIRFLIKKVIECGRFSNAWKYTLLLSEPADNYGLFDKALLYANFQTMMEDLHYIIYVKRYNEKLFYRELGILSDRIGNMSISADYFQKIINREFNFYIYINLVQVDHSKYRDDLMEPLFDSDDPYLRIASAYWKAHIELHDGIFRFEDFYNLLAVWIEHKDYILQKHIYDGLHLMRRWYFDCFRVYYLSGTFCPEKLQDIIQADLFRDVKGLPEYEAYRYKFQFAFFLHYDLLFQVAILDSVDDESIKRWDELILENSIYKKIKNADIGCKLDIIVDEARKYYQASSDGFKKIMDKSYRYSDLRICELRMAKYNVNVSDIKKNELYLYDYIAHSKKIKIDEYVAYGYTYLLKTYLAGLYCTIIQDNNNANGQIGDTVLYVSDEKIQECFTYIKKFHDSYRGDRNNVYALYRLNIYEILYAYLRNNIAYENALGKLRGLRKKAKKKGYHREELLLESLIKKKLQRDDILKVFKYYPLVMQ